MLGAFCQASVTPYKFKVNVLQEQKKENNKITLTIAFTSINLKPRHFFVNGVLRFFRSDRADEFFLVVGLFVCMFIYLFIGRESKRTYMTDVVKGDGRSMQYERVYVLHNI